MGKTVNGLDLDAFNATCELIKKDASLAKSQFRVHNTWKQAGNNEVEVGDFYAAGEEQKRPAPFTFEADEPPLLFGQDKGANPVEYLLTALSACMTTTIIYHAAARGYAIEALSSDFKGDLDLQGVLDLSKEVPIGYEKIEAVFHIKTDAPTEELELLCHFSPVYAMVSKAAPIEITFIKE